LIRLARKLQVLQNTISRVDRQEDTRQVKATNDQAFIMYRERVLAFFQSPQMKLRWRNQISHGAQGLDTVKFLCRCRHRRKFSHNGPFVSFITIIRVGSWIPKLRIGDPSIIQRFSANSSRLGMDVLVTERIGSRTFKTTGLNWLAPYDRLLPLGERPT
jgi:hypothetical protein